MKSQHPIPVILCGGAGSRLWPLSRASQPKPFVPLPDGETLFEKTVARAASLGSSHDPAVIVTNRALLYPVREKLTPLSGRHVELILEPMGRDTAGAIAVAVASLMRKGVPPSRALLFMPADHLIYPKEKFIADVESATQRAGEEEILTLFGIQPDTPHTGFGYIRCDDRAQVTGFVEKPDVQTAKRLIEEGALWNSGMFVAPLGVFSKLFETCAPDVWEAAQVAVERASHEVLDEGGTSVLCLEEEDYARVPAISFDYAVVEKAPCLAVVRADYRWSDIGSWSALFDLLPEDEKGNRVHAQDEASQAYFHGSCNTAVWAEGERMVAVCGVDELIVVDMPDVVLVTRPTASDALKQFYSKLAQEKHASTQDTPFAVRPWGHYVVLHSMPGYKVKKITVNPGHQLSYQRHRHRHEHWVVVTGEATVVLEDKPHTLQENQSIFIPAGARHRLANPGERPLEVIEVQYGDYLGEDDIERIKDDYIR